MTVFIPLSSTACIALVLRRSVCLSHTGNGRLVVNLKCYRESLTYTIYEIKFMTLMRRD